MVQHVAEHHLSRLACLYVRQSTLQQVFEQPRVLLANTPCVSEPRLWDGQERIVVIEQDLGHSGTSTADRQGFQ